VGKFSGFLSGRRLQSGTTVDGVTGTNTAISTDGPGTTYQRGIDLSSSAKNVYTIYGDGDSSMGIPAAYQEAAPFGANTGSVAAAFVAAVPTAAYDSWLIVGITGGDGGGSLSSIGVDWEAWTGDVAMSITDGAVFWMSLDAGPIGSALLAKM
jgi:hypothetical protein